MRIYHFLKRFFFYSDSPNISFNSFIERVSFESRTLLTSIVGCSEYLEYISSEPLAGFTSTIIKENSNELVGIFDSLYKLHLLRVGNYSVKKSYFSINEFLISVIQNNSINVNLQFESAKIINSNNLDVQVYSDDKCMGELLVAILRDCNKYSISSSDFLIKLFFLDEKFRIMIEFIPNHHYDSLRHNLFWTSDNYVYDLQKGPGISLALAKELVFMLNGSVQSFSKPKGSSIICLEFNM